MSDLISVIVPVYNAAKYIDDCVESVLMQSYVNFELLLVDDGSQDNSREICERLCRRDSRVNLICQKHKGVSAARNAGMRKARGKYLFFLDSDDVVHPQLLEALYKQQEEMQTDIATVSYCFVREDSFRKPIVWERSDIDEGKRCYLDNGEAIKQLCAGKRSVTLYGIGGKMIRREALKEVQFVECLTHGEDTLFLYQLFARGADVSVLFQSWYCYRRREGAATKQYSIAACRSRYRVENYIRNQEIKKRRISNAVHLEIAIIDTIMQWYIVGYETHDVRLKQYAKKLAVAEREYNILKKLDWSRRIKFFLVFHCYPLYRAVCSLWMPCGSDF